MLTGVDASLDRAVVLFEHVVQIWHRPMPAVLLQSALGFELYDGRRVSGMLVGVDGPRVRMVLSAQRFGQEALCCGRVLLGREEKVEGRAGGIHRPVKVTPLAFHPDVRLVHAPAVTGGLQAAA